LASYRRRRSTNRSDYLEKFQAYIKGVKESTNKLKQEQEQNRRNTLETLQNLSDHLGNIAKKCHDLSEQIENIFTFQWPTESRRITWNFGSDHDSGIDIGAKTVGIKGDIISAINSGTVTLSDVPTWSKSQSTYVIIKGDDGYEYRYVHLDIDASIKVGNKVTRGQKLGTMSDNGSPGQVHLHLEVIIDGKKTDPLLILPK